MNHYDVVWGNTKITDPAAIKIIKHSAFQRLKNIYISAYGYLYNLPRNSTRYDHSIGVYLLLNHFKASKKEQIAGLIHDISHTALSHVSTYALLGKFTGKEFHELQHKKFIKDSGLEKLLSKLGFKSEELLHSESFSLLENDLPDICADRLDYAMRDGLHLQILSRQQVQQILDSLIINNDEFVFSDVAAAYIYSFNFYLLNLMFYGCPAEAHFNNIFGDMIKYAISKGVLKESDWYSDDVALLGKLQKSKNTKIRRLLGKFNNKMIVYEDVENPDVVFPKKIRVVDPKVLIKGKLARLTELDSMYKRIIDDYKVNHTKHELPVKVVYKS